MEKWISIYVSNKNQEVSVTPVKDALLHLFHNQYMYCRPYMWCSISRSTVTLLPRKRRKIFLSVSFFKLDSKLLTLSRNTWQAYNIFSSSCCSLSGCNLLSQCCNSYEFCVSCCLNPARVFSWVLDFFCFFKSLSSISIKYLQYNYFLIFSFCRHKKRKYLRWRWLSNLPQVTKKKGQIYFLVEKSSKF